MAPWFRVLIHDGDMNPLLGEFYSDRHAGRPRQKFAVVKAFAQNTDLQVAVLQGVVFQFSRQPLRAVWHLC